ncbi:hypothetical protein ABE438_14585 [Bosea sp. TWI1241]|uniref:hypothetical protein n=1 Tax=Bosea sp. TWI1241 TaxID=3148904 RepID=UPI00320805D2
MAQPSDDAIHLAINTLTHHAAANYVRQAQQLHADGMAASLATSMVLDAALMAAASFLQTAVHTGFVDVKAPIPDILRERLSAALNLPTRLFPQRADGSFDPVGHDLH